MGRRVLFVEEDLTLDQRKSLEIHISGKVSVNRFDDRVGIAVPQSTEEKARAWLKSNEFTIMS